MNPRATLALFVITVLVLGGLIYLREAVPPTREAGETRRYALSFDPGGISAIEIMRGDERIALLREGGEWRLTEPLADAASPEFVQQILDGARFLEVRDRQTRASKEKLQEAGLQSPRLRLALRDAQSEHRIEFGAPGALPGEIFARSDGQQEILRVPDTLAELLLQPAGKFRDRRLTSLGPDDVEKITVRREDGEMTLRRERNRWLIEKPVQAAADRRQVASFLNGLLGLQIVSFQPDNGAAADAMLPGGTARVSLTLRGGGKTLELEVARPAEAGRETARISFAPRGGALEVAPTVLQVFDVTPTALRDRSLGDVDLDTVDRITVSSGGRTAELERESDSRWVDRAGGKSWSAEQVAALAAAFNEAQVTSFLPGALSETTGLSPPRQSLRFYAWLSENTAEEPAGQHVLAGADLGSPAPDGGVVAQVEGSSEIVSIPPTLPDLLGQTMQETSP